MFDFAARCDRARALMEQRGIDALVVSVGSDLPYLTGYEAMPSERLTMLVLPRLGAPTLVVPRLEAPRVEERSDVFSLRAWRETEELSGAAADVYATLTRKAVDIARRGGRISDATAEEILRAL